MHRMFHIAAREFVSTAMTKGFIFGGIVLPIVLMGLLVVVMPLLINEKVPEVAGTIAVVDGTGELEADLAERFSPEGIKRWQDARLGEVVSTMQTAAAEAQGAGEVDIEQAVGAMGAAQDAAGGTGLKADLRLEPLPRTMTDEELTAAKDTLFAGRSMTDGGRMAVVVIDENAVRADGDEPFGAFQVFVRPKLDDRVQDLIREQVRNSIRESRIRAAGFEPGRFDELSRVDNRRTQEVTETGERASLGELNMVLQFAFMFLMMMAVFVSGQYLLTTTIEEKSSRVIELLLASASPMSLMAGKIFGQMGVGLFLIAVYGALGWGGLLVAERLNLISPLMIVWFLCFFFIAYTIIASLMAAIGSAVNDMREAQSLMTPVMMIVMIPYMLWFPIARDPSGVFATVMSFVPGVGPFVMVIRLSSTEPPPVWQVLAAIAVGVLTAYVALWVAAKIFRVGLLQFGKAPNYATMIRWIRMA